MILHDLIVEYKSELIAMLIGSIISVVFIVFFIGRNRFTWLVKEIVKMYSANETSYFGKKRVESGSAFWILQWGMIYSLIHLIRQNSNFDMYQLLAWATVEAAISGYYVKQIQNEKKMNMDGGNSGSGEGNGNTENTNISK